jgi:hypothetical protein
MERVIERVECAAPPGEGYAERAWHTPKGHRPGGRCCPIPEAPGAGHAADGEPGKGPGLTKRGLQELADALLEYEMTRGDWSKSR